MEIGFWDYTCPQHGTIERYTKHQYIDLLDAMEQAGMNSLVLAIKWLTTGYYSKLPFLDQSSEVSAIASKNEILKFALREARSRGIKAWLLVVCNVFPPDTILFPELPILETDENMPGIRFKRCDVDLPGFKDAAFQVVDEIIDIFGEYCDGLIIELEGADQAGRHRIPLYNEWAIKNARPSFDEISKITIEPRSYPFVHWRDFATVRRTVFLNELLAFVRRKGFNGEMAAIFEIWNAEGIIATAYNLDILYENIGKDYKFVSYDCFYTRKLNHDSTIEQCIRLPKEKGFPTFFITRGVMTFSDHMFQSLTEEWDISIADVLAANPDGVWFMGSDCCPDAKGSICNLKQLHMHSNFENGLQARAALLERISNKLRGKNKRNDRENLRRDED